MFKKQFRVKSNTQIKHSEVKVLRSQLQTAFPSLTSEELDNIIPKKETVFLMKAICSDEKVVFIYFVQKRPITFFVDNVMFPTVYLLWRFPKIAIDFTTTSFVFSRIKSGADLMIPGIVQPCDDIGEFQINSVAYVNTIENKAAVAVGLTTVSSCAMQSSQKGKCVIIYHYYGDKLCDIEDMPILPIPQLGMPDFIENVDDEIESNNDTDTIEIDKNTDEIDSNLENLQIVEKEDEDSMDQLLEYCFMVAIKYSKNVQLPILTSTFYKLHMLTACPPGKYLDVKKSSYKKLGQFLKKMMKDGIVTVKEIKKGAENITAINKGHPAFISFYLSSENRPKCNEPPADDRVGPNIIEEYIVTQNVLPLFTAMGISKGERLQPTDIRRVVTEFVKKNNCQDPNNKGLVLIQNPHLAGIIKEDVVTWETLIQSIYKLMKPCYKLITADEEKVEKGKIEPINIKVETRSGNKKVTLIDNLELFGIKLTEFSKECQHGVAASTTTSKLPGKKYDQLMVQGNQVLFVYNLLIEKYKIPKKYIKGLEYAPKNKK